MHPGRIFISQSAESQLKRLPEDVRLHIETHLENLAAALEQGSPEQLLARLQREDEGFVANVGAALIFFSVDATLRALTVQRLEQVPVQHEDPAG